MDFIDDSDEDDESQQHGNEWNETLRADNLSKRPESCGVMQFHNGIEEALLLHVQRSVTNVSAKHVIEAVDQYCYSRHWMMHVGDEKGAILDRVVDELQVDGLEVNIVEIGSYCGYSAVRMASQLTNKSSKVYCIERESQCVEWTRRLAAMAGLTDAIIVIEGEVPSGIEYLQRTLQASIDLLFIDHDKSLYLRDLVLFEKSGLLRAGGVVVADNVLSFGCPLDDYMQHVRRRSSDSSVSPVVYGSSTLHRSCVEYSAAGGQDGSSLPAGHYLEDGVEVSVIETVSNREEGGES